MIAALLLVPALAGLAAFAVRAPRPRRGLLVAAAAAHLGLAGAAWVAPPAPALGGWLQLDAAGLLVLTVASVLFLAAAAYACGYLAREAAHAGRAAEEGLLFRQDPEAAFTGTLLLFLAAMSFVCVSHRFGLLWVAIEATTLASAPLIAFHRDPRSLEATWKYLMLCSVGIALALLGTFCLALAATGRGGPPLPLVVGELVAAGPRLDPVWTRAAFVLFLVGYGTKMGLAPLHAWLPDAHSEAPSVVSALLSGALLNCAALGLVRAQQVCLAAGQGAFAASLLTGFGLVSLGVAAAFLIGQADFKRLLAYSSVEHMGVIAVGLGAGAAGAYGAFLHAVNHSLVKAALFLAAGNLLTAYRTKAVKDVRGAAAALPRTAWLWLAGGFAIAGWPPFGTFLSEFTILRALLGAGAAWTAVAYVDALAVAFVALAAAVLPMVQGRGDRAPAPEPASAWLPSAVLLAGALALGCWVPAGLDRVLREAAALLGGA